MHFFLQKFLPSLSSSFSEKGYVQCTHKQHAVIAREEVVILRGVIWLGLCAASSVTIHFSHPPLQCTVLARNVTRQQGRGNGGGGARSLGLLLMTS